VELHSIATVEKLSLFVAEKVLFYNIKHFRRKSNIKKQSNDEINLPFHLPFCDAIFICTNANLQKQNSPRRKSSR
jgi:hypothetical protein